MRYALAAGVGLVLAFASAASAEEADLAALIECRVDDVKAYNTLAFAITGDERKETLHRLGLTEEKSGNATLAQYRLAAPLTVFGRPTDRVVFNSAGVFAVLDEADPHPLAKELGVEPVLDRPGKYLGEKVIKTTEEELDEDTTLTTRISLNVSTVDSHPGKILAGCGYRIETE